MENNIQNPFLSITDVGQAEKLVSRYIVENKDDIQGTEEILAFLIEALLMPEKLIVGDADDFHNFAIDISRVSGDKKNMLEIVKRGLQIHSHNTDLLADAINYGYDCGDKADCEKWYNTLKSINKAFWTWRAFSFSINYLLELSSSSHEKDAIVNEAITLADEYKKYLPNREEAWISEYEIYRNINQYYKAINVLVEADQKFSFCPKCWLRYVDAMIDKGDYAAAEPIVRKLCRNPKSIEFINASYMYYIDALCKMYRLMDTDDYEEGRVEQKEVMKIYKAFRRALISHDLRDNTKSRIDECLDRLYADTDIKYPDEW